MFRSFVTPILSSSWKPSGGWEALGALSRYSTRYRGSEVLGFVSPTAVGQPSRRHASTFRTANVISCTRILHTSSESKFLDQVDESVQRVLQTYNLSPPTNQRTDILDLPPIERQNLGVARILNTRLRALERNNDCQRCWLQRAHCVCSKCPPIVEPFLPNVRRIFLLMHHKEVALAVDTAKLILAGFPETCRLVVGGIGPNFQDSMAEMVDAMGVDMDGNKLAGSEKRKCLVLFPTENARTFEEIEQEYQNNKGGQSDNSEAGNRMDLEQSEDVGWDVIVIDGTWAQARKLHGRYILPEDEGGPQRVQLSKEAVAVLSTENPKVDLNPSSKELVSERPTGHQLRRHPIKWREVSTLEATRLLLGDMARHVGSGTRDECPWDALAYYQQVADSAARRQLGPPR